MEDFIYSDYKEDFNGLNKFSTKIIPVNKVMPGSVGFCSQSLKNRQYEK